MLPKRCKRAVAAVLLCLFVPSTSLCAPQRDDSDSDLEGIPATPEQAWHEQMREQERRMKWGSIHILGAAGLFATGAVLVTQARRSEPATLCDNAGNCRVGLRDDSSQLGAGISISLAGTVPLVLGILKRHRGRKELSRLRAIGAEHGWTHE